VTFSQKKKIKKRLKGSGCHEIQLNFISASEMEEVNYNYLGRHGPTSVISFPYEREGRNVRAEIFFCPAYIAEQVSGEDELDAYIDKLVEHVMRSIGVA